MNLHLYFDESKPQIGVNIINFDEVKIIDNVDFIKEMLIKHYCHLSSEDRISRFFMSVSDEGLKNHVENLKNVHLFVNVDYNKIVACVELIINTDKNNISKINNIEIAFSCDEDYRGKGICKDLIYYAIDYVHWYCFDSLKISTNPDAIDVYISAFTTYSNHNCKFLLNKLGFKLKSIDGPECHFTKTLN